MITESYEAVDLVRQALSMMLVASAPILLAGLFVGLTVSILQAMTQIQEQTLSFVPKIVAMVTVTIILAPWLAQMLMDFSARLFSGNV
ncbi:MAG: flagellar biosynthesis protein FliQ [Phycisphaeraceae bacterium]|nr:flagellar biosynthesis protein FliQ [Phycisphaeraceae bacterium]